MKYLKIALKVILVPILFVSILWLAMMITLQTEGGQKWALSKLISKLEQRTQAEIEIEKIEFISPLHVRIHQIAMQKDQTLALAIQQLDLALVSSAWMEGYMMSFLLHAKGVDVAQLPWFARHSSSSVHWQGDSLFPIYIKLDHLLIEDVHIHPSLVEQLSLPPLFTDLFQYSRFQMQGKLVNNPCLNTISAHLLVTAIDQITRASPLTLAFDCQYHQLALSLHLNNLPLTLTFQDPIFSVRADAACSASAPFNTWYHFLDGTQHEETPITGNFKIGLRTERQDTLPAALIGTESTLKGYYTLFADKKISISDMKLISPCCLLSGEGILTANQQIEKGLFQGNIQDLKPLYPWIPHLSLLEGTLAIQGELKGELISPDLSFQLTSPTLQVNGQPFENIHATLFSQTRAGLKEGSLLFEFAHQNIPYQIDSTFIWNPHQMISLPHFQFQTVGAELKGHLAWLIPDSLWDGQIQAHAKDLSSLFPLMNFPIQGQAQASLTLKPYLVKSKQKAQGAECQIRCQQAQWSHLNAKNLVITTRLIDSLNDFSQDLHLSSLVEGDLIQGSDLSIDRIHLDTTYFIHPSLKAFNLSHLSAHLESTGIHRSGISAEHLVMIAYLDHPLESFAGEIKLTGQKLTTGSLNLQELSAQSRLDPTQDLWPFTLSGTGSFKQPFTFQTAGSWHLHQDLFQVHIQQQSGHVGSYPFRLLQPFYVTHQSDKTELSSLNFTWGDATFEAAFTIDNGHVKSVCKGMEISSDLLKLITPHIPLTGKASFLAHLEGPLQKPQGQLQLLLHHMQISEKILTKKHAIEGELHFDVVDTGINLEGVLHGVGRNPVLTKGVLPFTISLSPFNLSIKEEWPFHISLQAEDELDSYLEFVYNDASNLSGKTKIALLIHGKMDAPQIEGEVNLYDGTYETLSTGAIYKNIQVKLEGNGSQLILRNFSAQDRREGSITAKGSIHLDSAHDFPFEFHIQSNRLFIIDTDYMKVSATGPLTLLGNRKQAKLQGNLTADEALISMEEALPAQVKSVDITYINVSKEESIPSYAKSKEVKWPLDLDIKLHMPRSIQIKGKNLTSEWKGELAISGTPEAPLLNGNLRVVRGEYQLDGKFFKKVFTLTQGNIHFAGAPDKKTSLYVVASKEINRIRADIIVKGPINKLAVNFRSAPPLSQREVLSYILFNRGISDITPDQGTQLSQSFMALSSSSPAEPSHMDFLNRLSHNIGIDRLDFSTSDGENQDLTLQVGKYISEDILISLKKSINDTGYRGVIEMNLRKNLQAQAELGEAGDDTQGKIMLKWKKDY